jgi:hypothetical protein
MNDAQQEPAPGASEGVRQRNWFTRFAKVGGIVLAVVGGFETLSALPDAITKDKTFFSMLAALLWNGMWSLFDFLFILFAVFVPLFIVAYAIGGILELLSWRRVRVFNETALQVIVAVTFSVALTSAIGFVLDMGLFHTISQALRDYGRGAPAD